MAFNKNKFTKRNGKKPFAKKKEHYLDGKEEWLPGHSLRSQKKI